MPTQDERFDDIADGQRARIVHSEIAEIVAERETAIVKALVSLYPAHLNHDVLVGAVGELAAGRRLLGKLENQIKKGIQATQIETNQEELS